MSPIPLAELPTPSPPPPYRSAHVHARAVVILLWIGLGTHLLQIPTGLTSVLLPEFDSQQDASENLGGLIALLLDGGLGLVSALVYLATVVLFMIWLYRCHQNVPSFGAHRRFVGHSPAWAVGSFFVPFANLVVPYNAMKELWQKSRPDVSDGLNFSSTSVPGFFPAWWGFWIASNIASNIYFRMIGRELARETVFITAVIADALSAIAALFAIMVVKEIDRRQESAAQHPPPSAGGPPPPPAFFQKPAAS